MLVVLERLYSVGNPYILVIGETDPHITDLMHTIDPRGQCPILMDYLSPNDTLADSLIDCSNGVSG